MCRFGKTINCPKCKDYFACMAEQKEDRWTSVSRLDH